MNKFFFLNCWLLNLFFFAKTFKSPLQHVYLFCKYNIISHYNFCNIKLLCIRIFWNTCGTSTGSHKDSVSMESRDGVEERDTVLVRGFYTAGTKTTPSFRDGIGASGSRNGTLDPESCDYVAKRPLCSPDLHVRRVDAQLIARSAPARSARLPPRLAVLGLETCIGWSAWGLSVCVIELLAAGRGGC